MVKQMDAGYVPDYGDEEVMEGASPRPSPRDVIVVEDEHYIEPF